MKFLDLCKVYIRSGGGGAGCVAFRREKHVEYGGPNGGDGGRGGDVWVVAVDGLNTLIDFRYQQHFFAKNGQAGMGSQRTGKDGDDIILQVPVGTEILDEDEETIITDLTEVSDRFLLAKGGNGGFGNLHFKSPTNRAPRRANPGLEGVERTLWLRLKLIADAGLLGLPNAGKSTFLAATSNAAKNRGLSLHHLGAKSGRCGRGWCRICHGRHTRPDRRRIRGSRVGRYVSWPCRTLRGVAASG